MDEPVPIALLADAMLEGLARRLRLLGYDCALAATSEGLLAQAQAEGRRPVTTSRRLAALAPAEVLLVSKRPMADQIAEVARALPIDFRRLVFTRCSRDNTALERVGYDEYGGCLPEAVRQWHPEPLYRCPACDRLYWPGTHARRLRAALSAATGLTLEIDP